MSATSLRRSRQDHCHRRGCTRDEYLGTILLDAEDVCLAEVHGCTGFYDTSDCTQALAPSLAEVRAFKLSRHGVLLWSHQGEPCKAGSNVGDGSSNPTMDKAQLLLMLGSELNLGLHMSWLDEREHAADVLHEFLTFEVTQDRFAEVWVLDDEFHSAKLARAIVNYT